MEITTKIPQWFREGLESIVWNFIGNLLPIWFLFVTALIKHGMDSLYIIEAIRQPYTYLVLSGAYMTSTFFIVSKRKTKSGFFYLTFSITLIILGYLLTSRRELEQLTISVSMEITVYLIFILSFSLFVFYRFKSLYNIYNPNHNLEREIEYDSLNEKFDNFE